MANSFSLEIDPLSSKHGWMDCWLVVDGERQHLDATSVFPPFGDVLAFARALVQNKLPYEFFWDEEGLGAKFKAVPIALESPRFRLQVDHNGEIVVDAELDRMQIAHGLLESLRRLALDCPGAESEWDFPYFLIENFERDLARGFPPQAAPAVAHFVFNQYHGGGAPCFALWLDNKLVLTMAMDDIAHFWQAWFHLLERIHLGDLPVDAIFKREPGDNPGLFSFIGLEVVLHFQADPSPEPSHVQFKVTASHPNLEPPAIQTVLDATIDPQQFVSAFVQSLKQFLNTDYLAFLESGENQFDLRSLPIERLIS